MELVIELQSILIPQPLRIDSTEDESSHYRRQLKGQIGFGRR
jgi:hypothetical protein